MSSRDLTSANRREWADAAFWRKICPKLSIEGAVAVKEGRIPWSETSIPANEADQRRQRLIKDGYALVEKEIDKNITELLREGLEALCAKERIFPASFILLFDETWELARISREILQQSAHSGNDFHFDILSWYIEKGGFSPHRDRQPEDAAASFYEDGQAKFITHWIALSDATPDNSCLYVIPKGQDLGYTEGDTDNEEPLRRALPKKESFQQIRALPRPAGTSLLFTHRIIHWGSARVESSTAPPRAAISFVCSDPSFEKPYIDPSYFTSKTNPPFNIRLLLVCAQLLIYYQRFNLPKETIKACYEYCKEYEDELEESYRQKVYLEFVKAMKEDGGKEKGSLHLSPSKKQVANFVDEGDNNSESEEDGDDAVLEEMLNAEQGGYGEFEDDYDATRGSGGEDEGNADATEEEGFDDEEEEEGISLFGGGSEPEAKRVKTN